MKPLFSFRFTGVAVTALCLSAQTPETQSAAVAETNTPKTASINEIPGLPPRSGPSDYPAQAKLGAVTIAADFAGHGVPTREGTLSTEDYVVVEVAFYGSDGKRLPLSFSDFSLRINGKKNPAQAEPFERVTRSVKDPEWVPPEPVEKSSSTSIGGGGANDTAKEPPKPPAELQRAWALRVKKATLPDGDRALPQAGLLYFPYGGKVKGIKSAELIYSGAAGKTTLDLQP
jgi:hypothetical protein